MASNDADPVKNNAALVTVVACLAVVAVAVGVHTPFLQTGGRAAILAAAIFLYLPAAFVWKSNRPEKYGLALGNIKKSSLETLLLAVAVSAPFYLLFFALFPPQGWTGVLSGNIFKLILIQLAVVAFPEEFFFRGWVQSELDEAWGRRWKLPGARLGPGWLVASLLFMAAHVAVEPTVMRTLVFFPGLLFGWLRARTSSVLYPTLLHAVFNITFIIAQKAAFF